MKKKFLICILEIGKRSNWEATNKEHAQNNFHNVASNLTGFQNLSGVEVKTRPARLKPNLAGQGQRPSPGFDFGFDLAGFVLTCQVWF